MLLDEADTENESSLAYNVSAQSKSIFKYDSIDLLRLLRRYQGLSLSCLTVICSIRYSRKRLRSERESFASSSARSDRESFVISPCYLCYYHNQTEVYYIFTTAPVAIAVTLMILLQQPRLQLQLGVNRHRNTESAADLLSVWHRCVCTDCGYDRRHVACASRPPGAPATQTPASFTGNRTNSKRPPSTGKVTYASSKLLLLFALKPPLTTEDILNWSLDRLIEWLLLTGLIIG